MTSPLFPLLKDRISKDGPMSVADYMAVCLGDPEHGYYKTRNPFGSSGDFVTAPEVSQMFGELIGLWSAVVWGQIGNPAPFNFVELGPGRGTLMADALRAARGIPGFLEAAQIHLVETSPSLRQVQGERLSAQTPVWHDDLSTLPDIPSIFVANEFFDALPIHQLVLGEAGWHDRLIGLSGDGGSLVWTQSADPSPLASALAASVQAETESGLIAEISPASTAVMADIGRRLSASGGAALAIDYGHDFSAPGDTFQALKSHEFTDALDQPGLADLTAHVDFMALADAARQASAVPHSVLTQSVFLRSLGIEDRARILAASGDRAHEEKIFSDLNRLIGGQEMGNLFKVLAITGQDQPSPPGFE